MKKEKINKKQKAEEREKRVEEILQKAAEEIDVELPPFSEVWEKIKDRVMKDDQGKS